MSDLPWIRNDLVDLLQEKPGDWWVYVIHCSDESLYTGITVDPRRRFLEHQSGRGAKYFRGRKPLQIVYLEAQPDRSAASKRELSLKQLSRVEKLARFYPDGESSRR